MRETLAQIESKAFVAGIVLWDDVVVEAAPIIKYMKRWKRSRVREYCDRQGWKATVVHELERERS